MTCDLWRVAGGGGVLRADVQPGRGGEPPLVRIEGKKGRRFQQPRGGDVQNIEGAVPAAQGMTLGQPHSLGDGRGPVSGPDCRPGSRRFRPPAGSWTKPAG